MGTEKSIANFKMYAENLNDEKMLEHLEQSSSFAFHPACYGNYQKKFNRFTSQKPGNEWHIIREAHGEAFKTLKEYINEEIVEKANMFYLSDLFSQYKAILLEVSEFPEERFVNYTAQHVQDKILCAFPDMVSVTESDEHNRKKIIYKTGMDFHLLLNDSIVSRSAEITKDEEFALELRN